MHTCGVRGSIAIRIVFGGTDGWSLVLGAGAEVSMMGRRIRMWKRMSTIRTWASLGVFRPEAHVHGPLAIACAQGLCTVAHNEPPQTCRHHWHRACNCPLVQETTFNAYQRFF